MGQPILRMMLFMNGAVVFVCGVVLLRPWYEGIAEYVHPKFAFSGAILLVAWGGFMLALATVGFRGLTRSRAGHRLFGEPHVERK